VVSRSCLERSPLKDKRSGRTVAGGSGRQHWRRKAARPGANFLVQDGAASLIDNGESFARLLIYGS